MKTLIKLTFLVLILSLLPSCLYRMPDEETASLIPMVNNPKVYQDRNPTSIPSTGGF